MSVADNADSVPDGDTATTEHNPSCGKCVSGVDPWHTHKHDGVRVGVQCPTNTPEPHWLGEFPMSCYNCHVEADS